MISDNTANIAKAFTVFFPCEQDDDDNRDYYLADPELRYDLTLEEQLTIDAAMAKKQRLQCFAHTPQLVVGVGLKATKVASPLSKLSKFSAVLEKAGHKKSSFTAQSGIC